jgi:hypothetical protein
MAITAGLVDVGAPRPAIGALLGAWRERRSLSRLELALE